MIKLLCKLGLHKWIKYVECPPHGMPVCREHHRKRCERCGKILSPYYEIADGREYWISK